MQIHLIFQLNSQEKFLLLVNWELGTHYDVYIKYKFFLKLDLYKLPWLSSFFLQSVLH